VPDWVSASFLRILISLGINRITKECRGATLSLGRYPEVNAVEIIM
jgi:hypothetical protein